MERCVTLKVAAARLGININVMHGRSAPAIIRKYIKNTGTSNQLFDIDAYKEEVGQQNEVIEKTTLLIEYLFHIEELHYKIQREITKVPLYRIVELNMNFKYSKQFLSAICKYDEGLIERFGDYYDFPIRFEKLVMKLCCTR